MQVGGKREGGLGVKDLEWLEWTGSKDCLLCVRLVTDRYATSEIRFNLLSLIKVRWLRPNDE